jgi:ribosomal-protein-alanine N-acetyltransferase
VSSPALWRRRSSRRFIRPLRLEDADELSALLVENRDFLAPFEPVRNEEFFTSDGQRQRIESDRAQAFAILVGDRISGTVTMSNIDYGPFQSATLGYWVAERLNGRGLATKAVAEVIEIAFGDLGLHRLEAATLVDNVPSQRVLEKNHFEPIGLARRYIQIAGEWRDHLLFQRTAD